MGSKRLTALASELKKFTLEELKQYDGREGRPAYIAFKGKVYDVTDSYLWIEGDHQGQHVAGKDLSEEISLAPHGEETLERVKQIGVLVSGQ
jgi:predicted heme/steroid binding protein